MSRPPFFPTQVERLCRVRRHSDGDDTPFELDADGFLDVRFSQWVSRQEPVPGALLTLEAAATGGALVLLGEPGVGKSSAFRRLTAGLPNLDEVAEADQVHAVLWVDGADLVDVSFDALIGDGVAALRGIDGACGLRITVVLDQIDESPMLDRLSGRLDRALRGVDTRTVRVLVACRTADFRNPMWEVLERHFAKCVLADLAPLSRSEATLLAGTRADGEALIRAAVAAGAGSLASVPLTLELLVRTYERDGHLSGDAVTLFRKGAWQLAEEPDPHRRGDVCSVEQRLSIAGRIAARLLLSGRRSVWLGGGLEAGPSDLAAGTLAGGAELTPSGLFDVSLDMVRETIGTALFTAHGQGRLGFRHSSLAAYLAADYVRRRNLPHHQLTSLFLVDAPDQDITSVPVPLRETAAWLIALDPSNTEWLATADPESLMAHSAIVSSDAIRALVVERLLDRAGEVELSDTRWRPGRWRVAHPQLADQLRPVLESAAVGPPSEWAERAKVRLAVRLARDAAVAQLAEPLLAIGEQDQWDIEVRQLAARTAMEANPDVAAPRLRSLLRRLLDASAGEFDRYDELEGLLLQLVWPGHMTLNDVLVHVRPPRQKSFLGAYALFLPTIAVHTLDTDLPALLEWARDRVEDTRPAAQFSPVSSSDHQEDQSLTVDPTADKLQTALPTDLVDAIVQRALESANATMYLGIVAELLWTRLRDYVEPPMPTPIDLVNEDGTEPETTQVLRRELARALIELAVIKDIGPQGPDVWSIVDSWSDRPSLWDVRHKAPDGQRRARRTRILAPADFGWALDQADQAREAGDERLATAMGRLAAYLFDGYDRRSFDLAYTRQDNPAWEHIRWVYDGVELDSQLATAMRRAAKSAHPKVWDDSAKFIDVQRERLSQALNGNTDAFRQLLWKLQFDPFTGDGQPLTSDDVRTFPGSVVLGDTAEPELITAAQLYLAAEHDRRDAWLGQAKINYVAWAGCMALVLLQRTDHLDEFPPDRWTYWAGALLSPHTSAISGDGLDRRKQLMRIASGHAPEVVASTLHDLLRGNLARGESSPELNCFDADYAPEVADRMAALLLEISKALSKNADKNAAIVVSPTAEARAHAVNIWADLMAQLLLAGDERSIEAAGGALEAADQGTQAQDFAIAAGRVLLYHQARECWPMITEAISDNEDLGRALALACSSRTTRERVTMQVSEDQLAAIYRWLTKLFPRSHDIDRYPPGRITPHESVRVWRDDLVRVLGQRGTVTSVHELRELASDDPDDLEMVAALINARRHVQATRWLEGAAADGIAEMLTDPSRRLVRTTAELANLLLDTLADIAADLPAHGELLWDRVPASRISTRRSKQAAKRVAGRPRRNASETWRPKPEAALSAYLAHQLKLRLAGHGVVINREVLVLPRDAYGAGDRPDIVVQANATSEPLSTGMTATPEHLTIPIEIKGAWNPELTTAQRTQLARYLLGAQSDTGLYIVGRYPIDQWTATYDSRKTAAKKFTGDRERGLTAQARTLRDKRGIHTHPFVMTIPRPHPAGE